MANDILLVPMPREPAYRIPAMAHLHRQLRFAPAATLLRQMNAAESLALEIDPDQAYPLDYLVYRLTGYRPDGGSAADTAPATYVGAAVREDLAVFIQRASERLDLDAASLDRIPIAIEDVARRLDVSVRTLRRYRRDGLFFHRVTTAGGTRALVCFEDVLDRFEKENRGRLDRARAFTRLNEDELEAVLSDARRRAARGESLNTAAAGIAQERARAHETIRGVLRRHDEHAAAPIFRSTRRSAAWHRRFVLRARERGGDVATIAKRLDISASSVRRAELRARADRLRRWSPAHVELPTLALDEADDVILSPAFVQDGLDALPVLDAVALAVAAHAREAEVDDGREDAWIAAYNLLKRRAARRLVALGRQPDGPMVDAAETDLRWATRLKRLAVASALPAGLRAAEQHLARPLPEQPAERLAALATFVVEMAGRVVEGIDPSRGQRLGRRTAYETDRALGGEGGRALADRAGRAAARHAGPVPVPDLLEFVTPWAQTLELRRDLRRHVDRLEVLDRDIVTLSYGLGPGRPMTVEEIAARLGTVATRIGRRRSRALNELRLRARESS